MHPGRIEGATRRLGAPQNWEKEKHGHCAALTIKDDVLDSGVPVMASVWFPTPEEIAALAAGAPVKLWVVGRWAPVKLSVGSEPC